MRAAPRFVLLSANAGERGLRKLAEGDDRTAVAVRLVCSVNSFWDCGTPPTGYLTLADEYMVLLQPPHHPVASA